MPPSPFAPLEACRYLERAAYLGFPLPARAVPPRPRIQARDATVWVRSANEWRTVLLACESGGRARGGNGALRMVPCSAPGKGGSGEGDSTRTSRSRSCLPIRPPGDLPRWSSPWDTTRGRRRRHRARPSPRGLNAARKNHEGLARDTLVARERAQASGR